MEQVENGEMNANRANFKLKNSASEEKIEKIIKTSKKNKLKVRLRQAERLSTFLFNINLEKILQET